MIVNENPCVWIVSGEKKEDISLWESLKLEKLYRLKSTFRLLKSPHGFRFDLLCLDNLHNPLGLIQSSF